MAHVPKHGKLIRLCPNQRDLYTHYAATHMILEVAHVLAHAVHLPGK